MNDPQDLLYTNNFLNTNIINEKEINEQTKNYDRFIEYQNNQNTEDTNNTLKYLNNDNEETDSINIQKSNYQPFPNDNNKNNYPMFDPLLKDLSKNVYTKLRDTVVNIDTGYRNPIFYPLSTNLEVQLSKTLNNIHQIEISNINIPNFLKSVNSMTNNFSWQYYNDYYLNTEISYNLIPFPSRDMFYALFDIKYSAYVIPESIINIDGTYDPSQFLTYQNNIREGNYTIDQLLREIEVSSTNILHAESKSVILQKKEKNIYNICEEPYYSFPSLRKSPHLWKFEINKQNGGIFSTNRIEEIDIYSIQMFLNPSQPLTENYFKQNDIFYKYSSLGPNYTLDPNYIYITVPFLQYKTDQWFNNSSEKDNTTLYPDKNYYNPYELNPYPLVITQDNSANTEINNFISLITMTTFWDLRIYTETPFPGYGISESKMKNISYYKISDIITIPDLNLNLIRFALRWSPSTSKGVPFQNSIPRADFGYFKPQSSNNIIFKSFLYNFLSTDISVNKLFTLGASNKRIGRALPCRFIYGKEQSIYRHHKTENIYETKKSILEYFDFSIPNSTNGDIRNIANKGFGYIHSNLYGSSLDQQNPINQFIESLSYFKTKSVDLSLKIINDNNYFLRNTNYVYIRFSFKGIDLNKTRQNENIISSSENHFNVNQNYSNSSLINYLGIGESVNCYYQLFDITSKNYDGIFCKIFTSTIPGDINILDNNISSKIIFNAYDNLLNGISSINIELLDSNLKIIRTEEDYSFDLRFIYSDSKLKETNINTQTNKIDLVGTNY
jgi:hypothetical protein